MSTDWHLLSIQHLYRMSTLTISTIHCNRKEDVDDTGYLVSERKPYKSPPFSKGGPGGFYQLVEIPLNPPLRNGDL